MGLRWEHLRKKVQRQQVNHTLKRVSRMNALTQTDRAEALLTRQIERIDLGSASIDQLHFALVLHISMAELYAASGQRERSQTEYTLCAQFSGLTDNTPRPLPVYLFWLYAREGHRLLEERQFETACDRLGMALQFFRHAPKDALTPEDALQVFLDRAAAEAGGSLFVRAARTLLEALPLLPKEEILRHADLLIRAGKYATHGKEFPLAKGCLEKVVAMTANLPPFQPKAAEALLFLSEAYLREEKQLLARETLGRAEEILSKSENAHPDLFYRIASALADSTQNKNIAQAAGYSLEAGQAAFRKEPGEKRDSEVSRTYIHAAELSLEAGAPRELSADILTRAINGLTEEGSCGVPLAKLYSRRGLLRYSLDQYEEEYKDYTEAIRLYETLEDGANPFQNRLALSGVYLNRAETAARLYGLEKTAADFRQAEALLLSVRETFPSLADFHLSRLYYEWGKQTELYDPSHSEAAEEKYRSALLRASASLHGPNKNNPSFVELYVIILERHGGLLYAKNCPAEARGAFRTALTHLKKLPTTDNTLLLESRLHECMSHCFVKENMPREALKFLEQSIETREQLLEKGVPMNNALADDSLYAGRLAEELEQNEKAEAYFQKAIELYEKEKHPDSFENAANAYYRLGNTQSVTAKHVYTDAMHNYGRSLRLLEQSKDSAELREARVIVHRARGELYANMHEYELAQREFLRAEALTADNEL